MIALISFTVIPRSRANRSNKYSSKEANLSHSTVIKNVYRNHAPTLLTLEAVCQAFGITRAQFFASEDEASLTEEQQTLFAMEYPDR